MEQKRPGRGCGRHQRNYNYHGAEDTTKIKVPKLETSRKLHKNNFSEWREALTKYSMLHYQQLGLIFRDDEYYVPPNIEEPHDVSQLSFMERAELETKVKQRATHIEKMFFDRVSLYAFLWNTLAESSQTLPMREGGWQTAENENDPLKLWLLIKATHLGNQGNLTTRRLIPGETNRMLLQNLNDTKMYPNEILSKYLKRFYTSLDAYEGAGIDPPDQAMVVAIFIENLCDERFNRFKFRRKNDYHQLEKEHPENLLAAFQNASQFSSKFFSFFPHF
jgi:hypothetical protein